MGIGILKCSDLFVSQIDSLLPGAYRVVHKLREPNEVYWKVCIESHLIEDGSELTCIVNDTDYTRTIKISSRKVSHVCIHN